EPVRATLAVSTPPRPAPPAVVERRSVLPLVGLVGGGVGVVAAGVGLGLYLDVDAAYARCAANRCAEGERARGQDLAAVTLLWGGGAVALAGLVTFLVAPRTTRTTTRAMLLPQPGGVALAGTF
ncbi:MAG: hypothetical protein JWM10_3876, partial [Myxococcaceae bacterium]|nr:hypothetical protein [Myxococcaceae bacterium]